MVVVVVVVPTGACCAVLALLLFSLPSWLWKGLGHGVRIIGLSPAVLTLLLGALQGLPLLVAKGRGHLDQVDGQRVGERGDAAGAAQDVGHQGASSRAKFHQPQCRRSAQGLPDGQTPDGDHLAE